MTNLETLKQQAADMEAKLNEMKAEIERLEKGWEMKCPYKDRDKYYIVNSRGLVKFLFWDNCVANKKTFNQGHIFPTEQAAELEAKRRNLLTRFRAFRDECNGDWKINWKDSQEIKYFIGFQDGELGIGINYICQNFLIFGYFKKYADCKKALELFVEV